MKSMKRIAFSLTFVFLVLTCACGRTPKQKDLYWRGELWDGMNRMVFTLEDLGFRLRTVDTDRGMIVAEMESDEESPAKGADDGARGMCRIMIQFPDDPTQPIQIDAARPQGLGDASPSLEELVSKITKRFAWYAGSRVDVRDRPKSAGGIE
jgi:hypothetical protein